MPTPFPRTLRALRTERFLRPSLAALAALLLIAAWSAWFLRARVDVVEVSVSGRVVVDRSVHPVETNAAGRIERYELVLGSQVSEGDPLVVLDTSEERMLQAELEERIASLHSQSTAIDAEIALRELARRQAGLSAEQARREAAAELRGLSLAADLAAEEHLRLERLTETGGVSEFERARVRLEAERSRALVERAEIGIERLALDQGVLDHERGAATAELARHNEQLAGEIAAAAARARSLAYEIERRTIRAPKAGLVAEVAELGRGSVVERGRRLGAVVSLGTLKVVAEFGAAAAVGRIRVGQAARLALTGFPASEYGMLDAVVTSIASEATAGLVRVELALANDAVSEVPLQHGLDCTVLVEVESVSPAELVVRSAGRRARTAPALAGNGS